ncbi:MAG: helix-turn-helix domain-containing protein [Blastocatellia bacterium]|nr:helix-turn-helix domain-containing protein [Blastocatellia bacterium]
MSTSGAAVEHILKEPRSAIIDLLKNNGAMSAEQLAREMAVSKVNVRRHLSVLESDGLIDYKVERHERGRPRYLYSLTQKACCLFPQIYDEFARDVLVQLQRTFGEEGLQRVLSGRTDELIRQLKAEFAGLEFDECVKRLAKIMSAKGYLAEARKMKDGAYRLRLRNCPTERVAHSHPQICEEELRIYRETLACEVARECHIVSGSRMCEYRLVRSCGEKMESAAKEHE